MSHTPATPTPLAFTGIDPETIPASIAERIASARQALHALLEMPTVDWATLEKVLGAPMDRLGLDWNVVQDLASVGDQCRYQFSARGVKLHSRIRSRSRTCSGWQSGLSASPSTRCPAKAGTRRYRTTASSAQARRWATSIWTRSCAPARAAAHG